MRSRGVLLFFACVVGLLALLCWAIPADGIRIGGCTLHMPSISQVLHPEKLATVDELMAQQELEADREYADSLQMYRRWLDSSNYRFWLPDGDSTFFDPLFDALLCARGQNRVVRVMHYGDSQIEMDHITSRLRSTLQSAFGGQGPGMMPVQTIIPSPAVSQWISIGLPHFAPFGDSLVQRAHGHYGPMTQCFRLDGSTTASFRATNNNTTDPRIQMFSRVGLLYSLRPGPLSSQLSVARPSAAMVGGDSTTLSSDGLVALHLWHIDTSATQVRITMNGNADIYGVLLDGEPGVAVDNIPMRGCSGQQFVQIDSTRLADAYALLDIGLIILQFGGNSVPYLTNTQSISTYCKSIGRQIDRVHHCCPKAKILFIGPSDMSTTRGGTLQSYPKLETIIDSLQHTANSHGAAYWSIYHAMGGHNSMLSWVSQNMAVTDYIHFNQKGANLMGDRLADAIMKMYNYYLLRKKKTTPTTNTTK